MTGREVMERALALLGYVDPSGDINGRQNAELMKRCVPMTNHILADMSHVMGGELAQIGSADEDLPVSDDAAVRVMVPGVAWLVAQAEADGDNQAIFSALYQQARGTLPREPERRVDVLPRVW